MSLEVNYNASFSLPLSLPECDGLDSFEIVNDMTLERFNNCNIIVNGGLFFGSTGNLE